jgi:hypothetical protein
MPKNLLLVLSSLIAFGAYSQNLTVDNLLKLRKSEIGYVEEFLTSKGWSFTRAEEPTDDNMGTATFAYNKNNYNDNAECFLTFLYSHSIERKRVGIQIINSQVYNSYLSEIKRLGCKLIDSKVEDNAIIKVYRGQTTTFKITTSTLKNEFEGTNTFYYILICDNIDYAFNFAN